MRLRFSNRSILQLAEIRDFITRESPRSAELVRLRILATIERLQSLPEMGHVERKNGTRELRVEGLPYIIVYRVESGDNGYLVILGIFHGAQDR
jgi:toxin ParE1/3/4